MQVLIDLSNNNGAPAAAALADPNVIGAYAKATEGLGFVDGDYVLFREAARKAKKPFGAYHFLHPDVGGVEQATFFLAHAKPVYGNLEPVIDSETLARGGFTEAAYTTRSALVTLKAHGCNPLLYGSTSFLESLFAVLPELRAFRIWQAQYASALHRIPGVRALLWQFTESAVVGKGRFRVDGDRLLVRSIAELEIPRVVLHPKPAAPVALAPPLVSEHGSGQETRPTAKKRPATKRPAAKKTTVAKAEKTGTADVAKKPAAKKTTRRKPPAA